MKIDKNTNPLLTALCAPFFMLAATVAVINGDLLIIFLFFAFCFAIVGSYVTEFPLFDGLYFNELAHKTSLSAMFAMLIGFIYFLVSYAWSAKESTGDPSEFSAHNFLLVWVGLAIPAYLLMIVFVMRINKRDLEAEQKIRDEKKKKRGSSGPPILNQDGKL